MANKTIIKPVKNIKTHVAESITNEYKATWLELFFDLVFVALVAQLTYYFSHHHNNIQDFLHTFIM